MTAIRTGGIVLITIGCVNPTALGVLALIGVGCGWDDDLWCRGDREGNMPHSILIVDDDEQIRDVLRRKLEGCGCDVCEAANGKEPCVPCEPCPSI